MLRKFFAKQRAAVVGQLHKSLANAVTKALPSKFVDLDDWTDELARDSEPLIQIEIEKGYETEAKHLARVGASPDVFNVTNPKLAHAVKKASLHFAESTNSTTSKDINTALKQLRAELHEGLIDEGESVAALAKRVGSVFDSAEQSRCELIAQTESSRAHHEGLRQAAKDSGVVKGFKLLLSSDPCDLCQSVADENGEIDLDGSFYTDDSAPEEYKDNFVPLHPACRCTCTEILTETD